MPRKGRELEKTVALLEKLLDRDVEMKSPDYIKGINSGSRREVDVSLRKTVGSFKVLVIVEVRDRQGTGDVAWIEQLALKRADVLADKAVAVSSAGFSSGARNTGARLGIELRTVENLTSDTIADWLLPSSLGVCELVDYLQHAELHVGSEEDLAKIRHSREQDLSSVNHTTKTLLDPTTGHALSIFDAWVDAKWERFDELTGLELTDQPRPMNFHVYYTDAGRRYRVMTDEGPVAVTSILFRVELSVKESKELPARIVRYSVDQGEPKAESVSFAVKAGEITADVGFHRLAKSGDVVITVPASFRVRLEDE